jgi:putative membrane protein
MDDPNFTEELSEKKKRKKEEKAEKEENSSQRTLLAFERTLLAWVRTGTHLMTFGFAIYKLLQERALTPGHHPILQYVTPKSIGLVMIGSGFIGILLASHRNIQVIRKYGKLETKSYYAPAMIQAYVVMTLCMIMILGALFGNNN